MDFLNKNGLEFMGTQVGSESVLLRKYNLNVCDELSIVVMMVN